MSTGVSVTYFFPPEVDPPEAKVELLVTPGDPEPQVTPALPQLTKGDWKIIWHLVAASGITNPQFDESDGIIISQQPAGATIQSTHREEGDASKWVMLLKNDVVSANMCEYDINGSCDQGPFSETFSVDPAIALTPDPPPGG